MNDLRYDFGYTSSSTYARAARLIASSTRPGIVVDLGAGVGTLAEPLGHFGFGHLGLDSDPDNVAAMRRRGRAAGEIDLTASDLVERVHEALRTAQVGDDSPVAAVVFLDVIEHLPDPEAVLGRARDLVESLSARRPDDPPLLVVSIPNVAHVDLAAKLLLGRWDVTDVGLLDRTHITLFDEARLDALMRSTGFAECGRLDVVQPVTEQRFPPDLPSHGDTTLGRFVRDVRTRATASGETYQFVRAYRVAPADVASAEIASVDDAPPPFLSVIMRTQARRSSITDALTALAAQHDDDFEVLLMLHRAEPEAAAAVEELVGSFAPELGRRVHVHRVAEGGRSRPLNEALAVARGRYVALLDDDDVVTSDWVGAFRRGADRAPGRVVRARCVVQWIEETPGALADFAPVSGFEPMYPDTFHFLDHVRSNRSPPCSYAVPMGVVRALDLRFDDELRTCEDWKFLMDAARHAGAESDPAVTSVYRRWRGAGGSAAVEDEQTWIDDHLQVLADLDTTPTLVPPGALGEIHRLYERVEELERQLGLRGPDDPPYRA